MDLGKFYTILEEHGFGHIFQIYFGIDGKSGTWWQPRTHWQYCFIFGVTYVNIYLGQHTRCWCSSHFGAVKTQGSVCKCAESPEPLLLALKKYGWRWTQTKLQTPCLGVAEYVNMCVKRRLYAFAIIINISYAGPYICYCRSPDKTA